MIVKICGVTRPEDAEVAARAGADWLGLNFWPRSKRWIDRERARACIDAARAARPDVVVAGVFVDQLPDGVRELADDLGLDRVQLHGDEPPHVCALFGARAVKALPMGGDDDLARLADYAGCEVVLCDTPSVERGGSGRVFDWSLARRAVDAGRRIFLAGGLTPDNVAAAIAAVHPWGVDVASGVESAPGIKDADRVVRFIEAAKGAV